MNAPTTQPEQRALVQSGPQSAGLAIAPIARYDMAPRNYEEAWNLADIMAKSGLVPKDFAGKPEACFIAMQWGNEIGLSAMQAVQNIAVINGRPSLWGDVMLALVRASPLCEYVTETIEAERAVCRVKRRNEPEQVREFTKADAEASGLWGKAGPWQQYKKRMLQMRARAWALRDVFTDILKGLHMAEEAMDMPAPGTGETFMGHAEVVGTPPPPAPTPAPETNWYPATKFEENFAQWEGVIKGGRKDHDGMIAFIEAKGQKLTEGQKGRIREIAAAKPGATPAPTATPKGNDEPFTAPTYAEVADKIVKAKTMDTLNEAGDLIQHVQGPELRAELQQKYDAREQELKN